MLLFAAGLHRAAQDRVEERERTLLFRDLPVHQVGLPVNSAAGQ